MCFYTFGVSMWPSASEGKRVDHWIVHRQACLALPPLDLYTWWFKSL